MTDQSAFSALFEEVIDRARFKDSLAPPIFTLSGTPGSGVDTLKEHLSTLMNNRAPWVRLSGRKFPDDRSSLPVTLSVANGLSRPLPSLGALPTPRFLLGFLATRAPLPGEFDMQRRADVIRRAQTDRTAARTWLTLLIKALTEGGRGGERLGDLLAFAADAAFVKATKALELRAAAWQWYGTALGPGAHLDPVSALVELSDQVVTDPESVDEVLCRALLADLRAAYPLRTMRFFVYRFRCAALISEADSAAVQTFLATVAEERMRTAWDPLVIVTSSTRRNATDVTSTKIADASLSNWLADREQRPAHSAARYDLAWARSVAVAPNAGPAHFRPGPVFAGVLRPSLSQAERAMVTFVRRATGAHPRGVELALAVLHDQDQRGCRGDPRDLMGRHLEGRPLDEIITDDLVELTSDRMSDIAAQVIYLAMARDVGYANLDRAVRTAPGSKGLDRLMAFRDQSSWVEFPAAGEPERPPTLHPLARRAIAHRLGRGVGWCNLAWTNVHERLGAAAGSDRVTRHYHDLAAGRVGQVADELDRVLDELDMSRWYDELLRIAEAPVREPAYGRTAEDNCKRLVGEPDDSRRRRVSPSLVAALQLHTDPLGDPAHQLCDLISYELGNLAGRVSHDAVFLLRRSAEFSDCARRWL